MLALVSPEPGPHAPQQDLNAPLNGSLPSRVLAPRPQSDWWHDVSEWLGAVQESGRELNKYVGSFTQPLIPAVYAAVALDNSLLSQSGGNPRSISYTHGANVMMLIAVGYDGCSYNKMLPPYGPMTITVGSSYQVPTLLTSIVAGNNYAYLYYIARGTAGTETVYVPFINGCSNWTVIIASVSGVVLSGGTSTFEATNTGGPGGMATVYVAAGTAGRRVIQFALFGAGGLSTSNRRYTNANQYAIQQGSGDGSRTGDMSYADTSSAITMGTYDTGCSTCWSPVSIGTALLPSGSPTMPPAYNNIVTETSVLSQSGGNPRSIYLSHSANALLLIGTGYDGCGGGGGPTSLTVDGTTPTRATQLVYSNNYAYLYYVMKSTSGTSTIYVSYPSGCNNWSVIAASFTGTTGALEDVTTSDSSPYGSNGAAQVTVSSGTAGHRVVQFVIFGASGLATSNRYYGNFGQRMIQQGSGDGSRTADMSFDDTNSLTYMNTGDTGCSSCWSPVSLGVALVASPTTSTITVTSSPTGSGLVTVDGSGITTPRTYTWTVGSSHTIAAVSPVSCGAGCQYEWNSWSDSGARTHSITVPSSAATYTANFKKEWSITFSYTVSGAGTPTAPSLSYMKNGVSQTPVGLTGTPTAYWVDDGTSWSVTPNPLTGSGASERWQTSQATSGSASASTAIALTYYHQYLQTLSYLVTGGGSGSAPSFTANRFGASLGQTLTTTATGYWFDSGASWSVTNPLSGSTSSERWYTSSTVSGTISSSQTLAFSYQHQYYLTMAASPSTAGTVSPSSGWQNSGASVSISASPSSGYEFSSWTCSGSGCYSGSSASTSITMNAAITETANFVTSLAAGTITPSSPVIDNGQMIQLTANPSGGTTPYSYQWYTQSSCTSAIPGATSSTYSASPTSTTTYYYRVTDSAYSATQACSPLDTVTVNSALATPTMSATSPIDSGQTMTVTVSWSGGTSTFTITLYTSTSLSICTGLVQVGQNTGVASSPSTFSMSPTATTYYCATVLDSAHSQSSKATTTPVTVTVNSPLAAEAITPSSPTIDSGQSVTLNSAASGGTTPYSYQWYTGASCTSLISGATSSTYPASPTSTTTFSYKVTDSSYSPASVCSAGDTVTVNSALVAPTVSASPTSIMAGQSSSLTSTTVTTGTSPYSYQWLQKGPIDSAYSAISGATSATFTFSTTSSTQLGTWSFELQVTDSAQTPETVPSNAVSLNVTPATVSVTITSSPSGSGFVSVAGSPITTPQIYNWTIGDTHTIAAQSPVSCGSGCQSVWQSWSDSGTQSHTIIVPSSATAYTATFQQEFQLTMQVTPSGSGSTQPSGTVWQNARASVQISASPSAGFQFMSWSGTGQGSYSGSSSSATVTMNGSITETANFQSIPSVTVTVSYSVAGGGAPQAPVLNYVKGGVSGTYTITQTPAAVVVDQGSSWSVTPNPLTGSTSTERWSSGQALNGTATGSATLAFTFQHQYFVSVSFAVSGGGSGYSAPSFTGISNGAQFSAVCSQTAYAYWLDAGSAWSVNPNPLTGSGSSERWFSSLELNGTVASANPVVATYHHQYLLMVSVTPAASATATPNGTTWQDAATTIMIQAFPVRGAFSSWSGTGSGSYTGPANPASVTMNAAVNETAIIADMVQVTIETSLDPSSSTVKIDGSLVQTPYSSTWLVGETHTVSATSSVSCGSGCQYAWQLWSDQGVQSHQVTAGGSNINLTATSVREYSLTVSQSQGGSTNPVSGTSWFISGDVASVSATAQPGYVFTGWLVDGRNAGGSSPLLLTMDAPHTVVPQFLSLRAPLCVYVVTDPASLLPAPSVTPSGCPLLPGAQVTVTAQAIPTWDFLEFTATNTTFTAYQNSITFTMPPASVSVVAHYKYSGPNAPGIAVPAANMPLVTLLSVIALLVLALKTRRLRKHLN